MIARIIKIGIPNFFEGISMWGANILVLMMIGWVALKDGGAGGDSAIVLGEAGIGPDHMGTESMLVTEVTGGIAADVPAVAEGLAGAHIIAVQWESFSFLPGFAIGTAAAALAGQYLGAGNTHMARRAVWICTGLGVVLMGLVGVVYAIWGRGLTAIVSDEPLFLEIVPQLLLICGVTQVFFAISMVVRQALRGVGDTTWTFLITTGSSYGIRLPAAWYFGVVLDMGLPGIWIGLCGELSLRAVFFLARFMYGGWATKAI
jgi:Na+-driven multidrug efflux pump